MSHTAGPWLKREMYAGTRRSRIEIYARFSAGRGEHPICQIPGGFTNQDEDAALILAAPKLLAALKALTAAIAQRHWDWGAGPIPPDLIANALDAISEAERGKS